MKSSIHRKRKRCLSDWSRRVKTMSKTFFSVARFWLQTLAHSYAWIGALSSSFVASKAWDAPMNDLGRETSIELDWGPNIGRVMRLGEVSSLLKRRQVYRWAMNVCLHCRKPEVGWSWATAIAAIIIMIWVFGFGFVFTISPRTWESSSICVW